MAKEELRQLVDRLTDDDAADALDYVRWLTSEAEALSPAELTAAQDGEEEIARGEYVTLEDLSASLRG